jgi:LPS O-antigen subunit length determinant protein (WzzB/FepE family)
MTELPVNSAEEIELIDFMRVIWKWKYLIAVGTLLFSVIAGIVSMRYDTCTGYTQDA